MALLADVLGRSEEVEALATRIEELEYAEEPAWLMEDLVLGLRARIAFSANRPEEALQYLDKFTMRSWHGLTLVSAYYSRVHERWLRIQVLRQLGHDDEAQRWIDNISQVTPFELPYAAYYP